MKISKALRKQFEDKARELVARCNPYIEQAVKYAVGGTAMFLYAGQAMTLDEINQAYFETAVKDIQYGYEQRMVGYYDKWYRYSHTDEGAAYDAGQRMAADTGKCSKEFHIIECAA